MAEKKHEINHGLKSGVVPSLSSLTAEWRAGLKWRWRFLEVTGYSTTCLSFMELSVPNDYISHGVLANVTWNGTSQRAHDTCASQRRSAWQQPAAVINNSKAHEKQRMDQSQVFSFFLSFLLSWSVNTHSEITLLNSHPVMKDHLATCFYSFICLKNKNKKKAVEHWWIRRFSLAWGKT